MSAGYAQRLSDYPNKGVCGLPESFDSKRAFTCKLNKLVKMMVSSRHTVVLTGAGISTSAGIPDFRGPRGIWTQEVQEKRSCKKPQMKRNKAIALTLDGNHHPVQGVQTSIDSYKTPVVTNTVLTLSPSKQSLSRRKRKHKIDCNETPELANDVISFEIAVPTYTHEALAHLMHFPPPSRSAEKAHDYDDNDDENESINVVENNNRGICTENTISVTARTATRPPVQYIVTQNVDGLHRKTNIPRNQMSILHGCIFTEVCDTCFSEHIRDFEIQSVGLKYTGRDCERTCGNINSTNRNGSCPGKLKDTLLDWEDDLPQLDWERAEEECRKADLILCLGTSLRIEPAASLCNYPNIMFSKTKNNGSAKNKRKTTREETTDMKKVEKTDDDQSVKPNQQSPPIGYVIVNLQPTPYDDGAALVIRAKVDDVMKSLMIKLGYGEDWKSSRLERWD